MSVFSSTRLIDEVSHQAGLKRRRHAHAFCDESHQQGLTAAETPLHAHAFLMSFIIRVSLF